MIMNPDPSKYIIKKLRHGDYILVDKSIVRWRKKYRSPVKKKKINPLTKLKDMFK